MGKIYLIECNSDGYLTYKIGKTNRQIKKRLKELSTGNPGNLEIVSEFETENTSLLENALHRHFEYCHINGEWFNDNLTITKFLEVCNIYDKSIKLIK